MTRDGDPIPLFEIDWDQSDISNVVESIERGGYWAKGPYVDEFESELERYLGVDHALTVNSGTTALVAALESIGVGEGDEVIVPSFTFIATANAVRLAGGEPIFADIEQHTYGLDPSDTESKITDSTAAILPVHCYGTGCRIEKLRSIADEYGTPLIEDAAEALGAEYGGQNLGTIGDIGVLSFCQNKIVATGEGGAVVTDDDEIAEKVKLYRSHGRASNDYFESSQSGEYVALGTNIRMSDLTAALGCSQLGRIDSLIDGRRSAAQRMNRQLDNLDGVCPHTPPAEGTHVYQLYTVEFDDHVNRTQVIETLNGSGIASKVYWDPPAHLTEYYRGSKDELTALPVTEDVTGRVLSLPMHPNLSFEEVDRIVGTVAECLD